jgi:hypothetical protein
MAVWFAWAIVSLRRAAWAPVLVFVIHLVAILGFDIYSRFPEFDIPMHFVGGVAIAYFFGRSYRTAAERDLLGQPATVVFAPMILGLTCLAAVIWEFAEFVVDQRFGIRSQPGLADTMLDLLMGLLGGAIWIAWNRERSR